MSAAAPSTELGPDGDGAPDIVAVIQARDVYEEDKFTYLTLLDQYLTTPLGHGPDGKLDSRALPVLNATLLQDVERTQDIGWDLVQPLISLDGAEECLETIARVGNPREVIIKVMEALDVLARQWEETEGVEAEGDTNLESIISNKFITLVGMISILQGRIKTKRPSSFLGPSLSKVFKAYHPTPEMTTAIINLVRSLSGRKRPPLPQRVSSINVADPDKDGDASKNAPDPEAEQQHPQQDPLEGRMREKMLQCFTTCVLQRYVNDNDMQWSARLLETYYPKRIVPGRPTMTQAFKEDENLQKKDAIVGQLAALLRDLGIQDISNETINNLLKHQFNTNAIGVLEDCDFPDEISLSEGGVLSLLTYWFFSTDIFGAHYSEPSMHLIPDHCNLIARFLGPDPEEAQARIIRNPGLTDAILAIGLALNHRGLIASEQYTGTALLAYHHHLGVVSLTHQDIQVRNAATAFAGTVLHSEPNDSYRFDILEDLFESCQFASFKACGVQWLKEEIMAAKDSSSGNLFQNSDVIERFQYTVFPDMLSVSEMNDSSFVDFWAENSAFILQAANFAYYIFNARKDLLPDGMESAIKGRFVEPLIAGTAKFLQSEGEGIDGGQRMELDVLVDRLNSL
ncbi:DUF1760-domain-containing protein [Xylariaceae sp. FL1272]|nr:DUF1760-domain-containing protein [Xylariaceae sp. FL1272]